MRELTTWRGRAAQIARALAALPGFAVAGCIMVGPDFQTPTPPAARGYGAAAPTETVAAQTVTGGAAQRFVESMDIPAQWWVLFNAPELSALVERALKANPTVAAAQAALRNAIALSYAQAGSLLPALDGSFDAGRQKTSNALSPTPANNAATFNLFTGQLNLSYVPDVFGGARRQLEGLQAQAEVQYHQLEATYLTLASNVVTAAVQEASLRAQIRAVEGSLQYSRRGLDLLRTQQAAGYAAPLDVAAQETQVAQTEAQLAPLRRQLAQQRNLLAALVGAFPDAGPTETFELERLELPRDLPVSLPAQLVRQRPDIRAAEATLHAASAEIGVAVANRLPNIVLTASVGRSALKADQLFDNGNGLWSIAGAVTQPLFHGFALYHQEQAARAAFDQAAAQYRSTVVTAFQNVADALVALQYDAEALRTAAEAERAAGVQRDIVRRQMEAGQISYLGLVVAEQAYLNAVVNRIQAQAGRYADAAGLIQALGGGWWNRPAAEVTAEAKQVAPERTVFQILGDALPWR